MAKTQAQLIAEFNAQIEALQAQKKKIEESAKTEIKDAIEKILEGTDYKLYDLFEDSELRKPKAEGQIVVIENIEYSISRRVTNEIKEALKKAGKDADSYDKKKLIEEFGKK